MADASEHQQVCNSYMYCSACIIIYSDKSEQICAVINICQTFEGCRHTFEG